MRCPKCEVVELTMADRAGIEIDYCTACRGVWLDRGELDKIIERSMVGMDAAPRPQPEPAYREPQRSEPPRDPRYDSRRDYRRDDDDDDDYRYSKKKKKGGFLADIFDFD